MLNHYFVLLFFPERKEREAAGVVLEERQNWAAAEGRGARLGDGEATGVADMIG